MKTKVILRWLLNTAAIATLGYAIIVFNTVRTKQADETFITALADKWSVLGVYTSTVAAVALLGLVRYQRRQTGNELDLEGKRRNDRDAN